MSGVARRALAECGEEEQAAILASLPPRAVAALNAHFPEWAHEGQLAPPGAWRTWVVMAGRGFGKTRAGAEWVWARARENPSARIALVGGNIDDVVKVMVEGPGGLASAARTGEQAKWVASRRRVDFSTGAQAFAYSAETPDKLRGPEHDHAWCDELAKWSRGEATWDNLMLGLRRGERPRTIVTTTPRTVALLRRIMGLAGFTETTGRTADNRHVAERVKAERYAAYGGSRLGRQELDAELFEDFEGALWSRGLLEAGRSAGSGRGWRRVVVGVDPPASVAGSCGIVVCGLRADGIGEVLADCTVAGQSPEGWARVAAAAAAAWGAHRVVAERNNGGPMVESVLRVAEPGLPVKLVHAADGKSARAEPVAALFEARRARLAGVFPELEDQLCRMIVGGGYDGIGSPDRADAMVWAMTELMLGKRRSEPRIRLL